MYVRKYYRTIEDCHRALDDLWVRARGIGGADPQQVHRLMDEAATKTGQIGPLGYWRFVANYVVPRMEAYLAERVVMVDEYEEIMRAQGLLGL